MKIFISRYINIEAWTCQLNVCSILIILLCEPVSSIEWYVKDCRNKVDNGFSVIGTKLNPENKMKSFKDEDHLSINCD